MRFAAYAGTSMVLATGVIIRAVHERANFYSVCVYLAQSNACLMILTNFLLLILGVVMLGLQKLLYGPLRPIEIEQLYEKAWFAVTETCLAMTIFREEVGVWFVVMFVLLLIGKVWGWIGEGRVEILEQQPPANPRLFHARLSTSLVLSFAFDTWLLNYSAQTVRRQARPNMMVMFAFEFAVLAVTSMSTFARYCIALREAAVIQSQIKIRIQEHRDHARRERQLQHEAQNPGTPFVEDPAVMEDEIDEIDIDVPGWEEKGRWTFYLDLVTDFFKLVLYLAFFCVLCMFFGMPIHIIRDVALTIRSFYKRITDFAKYRKATRDMNDRYPDATAQEIGGEDLCIICRDGMRPWQPAPTNPNEAPTNPDRGSDERLRPKKLPCGHILHFACLRSWLERQQNCPTCRAPVLASSNTPAASTNPPQPNNPGAQPPQNGANGVAPAPALGGNRPQAPPQNRLRFFNFGPFRIGYGAGEVHALEQELRAPQRTGQQQSTAPRFNPTSMQAQLQSIEQQLMQEINGLQARVDQLWMVRALQGELARLRIAQANGTYGAGSSIGQPSTSAASMPVRTSIQAFGIDPHHGQTGAANDLPPGVTVPEGWTLMPLQRLGANSPFAPGPIAGPLEPTASAAQNAGPSQGTPMPAMAAPPPSAEPARLPTMATPGPEPRVEPIRIPSIHNQPIPSSIPRTSTLQIPSASRPPPVRTTSQTPHEGTGLLNVPADSRSGWGSPAPRSSFQEAEHDDSDAEEGPAASSAETRAAKGKGRAATIEDTSEDSD